MGERKRCSACGVCHVAYSLTNISSISPRASSMSQSDCLGPLIFRAFYRVAMGQARPFTNPTFSCSLQASDHYIWLPHSCLCQTDIWKSFEMVRSGSVRKMHSDDGRMIKFIISFGSVTETCF